jgi:flagellar FliL protein
MADPAEAVKIIETTEEDAEETEQPREGEVEQVAEKRKRSLPRISLPTIPKKLLIIGAAVVVLGVAGFLFRKPITGAVGGLAGKAKGVLPFGGSKKAKGKSAKKKAPEQKEPGPRVNVGDEFVLNLKGDGFVRLMLTLEMNPDEMKKHSPKGGGKDGLGEMNAPIRDTIICVVATKTREELLTPEGKQALKQEIKDKINEVLHAKLVEEVYFTYFAIQ